MDKMGQGWVGMGAKGGRAGRAAEGSGDWWVGWDGAEDGRRGMGRKTWGALDETGLGIGRNGRDVAGMGGTGRDGGGKGRDGADDGRDGGMNNAGGKVGSKIENGDCCFWKVCFGLADNW